MKLDAPMLLGIRRSPSWVFLAERVRDATCMLMYFSCLQCPLHGLQLCSSAPSHATKRSWSQAHLLWQQLLKTGSRDEAANAEDSPHADRSSPDLSEGTGLLLRLAWEQGILGQLLDCLQGVALVTGKHAWTSVLGLLCCMGINLLLG
jgi:hypothetical protein